MASRVLQINDFPGFVARYLGWGEVWEQQFSKTFRYARRWQLTLATDVGNIYVKQRRHPFAYVSRRDISRGFSRVSAEVDLHDPLEKRYLCLIKSYNNTPPPNSLHVTQGLRATYTRRSGILKSTSLRHSGQDAATLLFIAHPQSKRGLAEGAYLMKFTPGIGQPLPLRSDLWQLRERPRGSLVLFDGTLRQPLALPGRGPFGFFIPRLSSEGVARRVTQPELWRLLRHALEDLRLVGEGLPRALTWGARIFSPRVALEMVPLMVLGLVAAIA